MPLIKRPSFRQYREDLEREVLERSHQRQSGSQFDHPTAKYVFIAGLVVTVVAHIVLGVVFLVIGF